MRHLAGIAAIGGTAIFRQLSDARNTDLLPVVADATFDCRTFRLPDFLSDLFLEF
jgi:hypothetical protein